jgi:hypothetical protein
VSLHRQVQKEQVTAVSLEGSHILSSAVVTGFHPVTVQLIDQRASLESRSSTELSEINFTNEGKDYGRMGFIRVGIWWSQPQRRLA